MLSPIFRFAAELGQSPKALSPLLRSRVVVGLVKVGVARTARWQSWPSRESPVLSDERVKSFDCSRAVFRINQYRCAHGAHHYFVE